MLDKSQFFQRQLNGAYAILAITKKARWASRLGAGVDVGHITADVRYEGGLTKINENYGQRQNLWALSVGFKFF
jgi:hypothetical protein